MKGQIENVGALFEGRKKKKAPNVLGVESKSKYISPEEYKKQLEFVGELTIPPVVFGLATAHPALSLAALGGGAYIMVLEGLDKPIEDAFIKKLKEVFHRG